MKSLNDVIAVNSSTELYSYIVNEIPAIKSEIGLPTQGDASYRAKLGKLITSNERYKNAFINALDVIGLTVIQRNMFENPWDFTDKGNLLYGQQVREIAVDIAPVFDYNDFANDPTNFLKNVVPNVFNQLHNVNFQKFYKVTTSDEQIAMAFSSEDGIFNLLNEIVRSMYEAYEYDMYIVNKYQLTRRLVDGTITMIDIPDYETLSPRERVSFIKNYSNKMTFMSPNYNPAGLRLSTPFDKQIMILNTDFEASLSTEVLATSFFRNDADFKSRLALIDGFDNQDTARLVELLGKDYEAFTDEDLTELKKVPCVLLDENFFQDYHYAFYTGYDADNLVQTRETNFYNPESLRNNHWLHNWMVIATSPFKQAIGFIENTTLAVNEIIVSPEESTVSAGGQVQLSAEVSTTGFANKSVVYSIESAPGESEDDKVTVDSLTGLVKVPKSYTPTNTDEPNPILIKVTSVFDSTKTAVAKITVL